MNMFIVSVHRYWAIVWGGLKQEQRQRGGMVLPPGRQSPSGRKVVGKWNVLTEKTHLILSTHSKALVK